MRCSTLAGIAAGLLLTVAAAGPALAGYGAIAVDEAAGKFGYSANEATQSKADELAVKGCATAECKVVTPVGPKECGAFAAGEKKVWGAAVKPGRAEAELAALLDCQKRTPGQCKVVRAECNR